VTSPGLPAPATETTSPSPRSADRERAAGDFARVAVLGASGYSGLEFTRLALSHPGIELAALCSRDASVKPADGRLPGIDARGVALPACIGVEALASAARAGSFDTLVSCLPHGALIELQSRHPELLATPRRLLDLSGDFRDESDGFRYGLPEAFRASIAKAPRVANPGCYPTAVLLALLPALERGWVNGPVMVSAISGVSGAGRAAATRTSFVEIDGGTSMYRAGGDHPHAAEMARVIAWLGLKTDLAFAPQLVPMARGILATVTAPLAGRLASADTHEAYAERYAGEPFVRVLESGDWPETRAVRVSNRCDVAVTIVHGGRTLMVASAIDNLVKGSAGQALQNLNLMLGWDETTALPRHGSPW
jgi:N-acetyl-gamma-glutamyl-phosphate reductase